MLIDSQEKAFYLEVFRGISFSDVCFVSDVELEDQP